MMFGIFAIIGALFLIKEIIKDAMEKPAPKEQRFDWDAYWKDIDNGIGAMEQVRKRQSGGYWTTEPIVQIPPDAVVDVKRYEQDKKKYGEEVAERWRQRGDYREIRKY